MKCINCIYKFTCKYKQEDCERYKKEPYMITIKENGIKKIRGIEDEN